MRRTHVNLALLVLVMVLGYVAWLSTQWADLFTAPMLQPGAAAVEFEIHPGTPLIVVAWQLKRAGLLNDPKRFILLARLQDNLSKIKAGEYLIEPGKTTAAQFLKRIVAGKVMLRQLTIIDGWTFHQILNAVNNNPYLQHTLSGLDGPVIMQKLGHSGVNPEGQFYPNTYFFSKGTADTKILQISYQDMQNVLQRQWAKRAPGLPYQTPYQALIAASLIERETSLPKERPEIAGVIERRLQKNMRLEIDPTVIYALGAAYQGKLTFKDLSVDSPYNTYLHFGLPPTPIAAPSKADIAAALHPTAGDALYYVASGKGGHIFSATLKQHDVAIRQYLAIKKSLSLPQLCTTPELILNFLHVSGENACSFTLMPQLFSNAQ